MADQQPKQPHDESRRKFLKISGAALGGLVAGGVIGGVVGRSLGTNQPQEPPKQGVNDAPANTKDYNQALMFLNQEQFRITEAAAERIFPKDELGPGAKELGVAFFIDHQLAGPWGMNARDYMVGPFYKSEATQGYQAAFKRHELFTMGLNALREYSQTKFSKAFDTLEGAQQDEVLTAFEKGDEVQLHGIPSTLFFNLLRSLTIEGVYADPLYGGNKNMQGWRMKNFPGDQMSFFDKIDKDEVFKLEPAALHDHLAH